jgi:hypothetical protein
MNKFTDLAWRKIVDTHLSETNVANTCIYIESYMRSKLFTVVRTVEVPEPVMTVPVAEMIDRITVEYDGLDPKSFTLHTNAGQLQYKLFALGQAQATRVRIYESGHHVKMIITHYDAEGRESYDTFISIN